MFIPTCRLLPQTSYHTPFTPSKLCPRPSSEHYPPALLFPRGTCSRNHYLMISGAFLERFWIILSRLKPEPPTRPPFLNPEFFQVFDGYVVPQYIDTTLCAPDASIIQV